MALQCGLQRASVDSQILADHGVHFGLAGERQFMFLPAALTQGVERRARNRGGKCHHMPGELPWQESRATVGLAALHLIEAVEHEDDAAFAHGLGQPKRQVVAEFFRIRGNVVRDVESAFQFAQQAAQEALR